MRRLVFLGTGYGMPRQSSCSAILVEDETNNLLLDTGGGHDLIRNLYRSKKDPALIKNVFISHHDSDHILGIVPLVRSLRSRKDLQPVSIYGSEITLQAAKSLFTHVQKKQYESVRDLIRFEVVADGQQLTLGLWKATFFDIKSQKTPQFGCLIQFQDKTKLAFLGDEPLQGHNMNIIYGSTVVIHEAFCLDEDKDLFRPHGKAHGTVKDAAINATKAGAQKLVLWHMEDESLETRKDAYCNEARQFFKGEIFVPIDLDHWEF